MMLTRGVVDFYIDVVEFFTTTHKNWCICDGAVLQSRCLAVHDELDEAIKHAIKMAEYQMARGSPVQIHVKQQDGSWDTVWRSPEGKAPST